MQAGAGRASASPRRLFPVKSNLQKEYGLEYVLLVHVWAYWEVDCYSAAMPCLTNRRFASRVEGWPDETVVGYSEGEGITPRTRRPTMPQRRKSAQSMPRPPSDLDLPTLQLIARRKSVTADPALRIKRNQPNISLVIYAALSASRSLDSQSATRSETSQSRSVTPAAIAGLVRSVR